MNKQEQNKGWPQGGAGKQPGKPQQQNPNKDKGGFGSQQGGRDQQGGGQTTNR